jgi:hypothetical protein
MSMLGSLLELEERREDRVDFRTVIGLPFLNQAEAPWKEGGRLPPVMPARACAELQRTLRQEEKSEF